ncbi:MAG TPA: RDD family protein [Pyrinomonadaceae bacterium]|nr:RDD family protein [Pyrinomonadaceae bacterium]
MKCAECGAFRNRTWVETEAGVGLPIESGVQESAAPQVRRNAIPKPSTSLIEFPSPGRQPIPQWRKELGERVREVQERRAREASLESGEITIDDSSSAPTGARPLELLTKPNRPPTNPLVVAALRRIERAYAPAQYSGNTAVATAAAYDEQPAYQLAPSQAPQDELPMAECAVAEIATEDEVVPERTHHLSVVAPPVAVTVEEPPLMIEAPALSAPVIEEPLIEEPAITEQSTVAVKPKRLIRDNDPALDYLDSVPTTVHLESNELKSAPFYARIISAIFDLIVAGAMTAPLVALVNLTELEWQDPRVIGFAAGAFIAVAFLYFTVSTALTGRTFAMRLFSLRVIDARTGLIPTGAQSTGRALFYLLSLATAGIGLIFSFIDRENRTAHDRFTRTAVVRV